ncbi:MAG: V-type ATP synthase subunit E [Ruminiclostridium sp.]|nr:V-type ATP synthase subunit E [Ruminiclostridium sp.]
MAEVMTKLDKLRQQIRAAAELDAKRVLEDAEKRAKAMTDEESERIEKEQGGAMLSKVSRFESGERKRVSESRYAADRKVLLHRNALVDGLFDDIKAELSELTSSDRYKSHLEKCAERADSEHKISGDVTVYCRKEDLTAAGEVMKKYGAKVAADRNITLGGLIFKYPDKGLFIDLTLDTAFENERSAFASRSEMQL